MQPYSPYIPKTIGEIVDLLGWMILGAPLMEGDQVYFPSQSAETEFFALREGLGLVRKKIGEDTYLKLIALSEEAQRLFKADPEDNTGDTDKGRACIFEMEDILKASARGKR